MNGAFAIEIETCQGCDGRPAAGIPLDRWAALRRGTAERIRAIWC